MQVPHDTRQYGRIPHARIEHPQGRRLRIDMVQLTPDALCDRPLLRASRDEQQIFLSVVEKPKAGACAIAPFLCVGPGSDYTVPVSPPKRLMKSTNSSTLFPAFTLVQVNSL